MPKIALNVPEPIAAPNIEKHIKRLIIDDFITEETFFFPLIHSLLLKLGLKEVIYMKELYIQMNSFMFCCARKGMAVIAMDGSVAGRNCICLVANVYKKRALPLAFTVIKSFQAITIFKRSRVLSINKILILIIRSN